MVNVLLNPGPNDSNNSTAAEDVDLVGRYLLVSFHPNFGLQAFKGVTVYDTSVDPYHPVLISTIPFSNCGLESAQLDPEADAGRPYAYCNAHCLFDPRVFIVNILTGAVVGSFVGPESYGCPPFPCLEENAPHEAMVQRHPRSGRMLDYVGYWDSGLRIIDVTDPTNPVEVGAFDYGPGTPNRNAHGAVVTPSGDWVYVGDEFGANNTGGVHVFDTHACDGTAYCTPTQVGEWHISGHTMQNPDDVTRGNWLEYDVHNMDVKGENTLLVANYKAGVRLVDTSDKTDPEEISFYLPNNNGGGTSPPIGFFAGRRTWVALFGSDGRVYASDITLGFFCLELNSHTVLPTGAFRGRSTAGLGSGDGELRVVSSAGKHTITFTTARPGRTTITIYDISGRRVAEMATPDGSAGLHSLEWNARSADGKRAANGIYLARVASPDGVRAAKVVQLAE
jgi:hypothetical protein